MTHTRLGRARVGAGRRPRSAAAGVRARRTPPGAACQGKAPASAPAPATRARGGGSEAAALPVRPVPPVLSPLHRPSAPRFSPRAGSAAPQPRGGLSSGRAAPQPRLHRERLPKFNSPAALRGAGAAAGSRLPCQGPSAGHGSSAPAEPGGGEGASPALPPPSPRYPLLSAGARPNLRGPRSAPLLPAGRGGGWGREEQRLICSGNALDLCYSTFLSRLGKKKIRVFQCEGN